MYTLNFCDRVRRAVTEAAGTPSSLVRVVGLTQARPGVSLSARAARKTYCFDCRVYIITLATLPIVAGHARCEHDQHTC